MTVYNCEQDLLRDQVHSNTLAIRYLKEKLEMVHDELVPDYMGTEQKVIGVLEDGIQSLKEKSKEMRRRIKELNHLEADSL
mgnify:FL=1